RSVLRAGPGRGARRQRALNLGARQGVDLRRQLEVGSGQAALGVGGDRHRYRVPGDRQVGMVVHPLGRRHEAVDEADRADEIAALEALGDRLAGALPAGELGELRLDLLLAQQCHSAYAGRRTMAAQSGGSRPTLWQIPISHYSEKARWAL